MSNDKSDISDMPDVMFVAKDEMSNDHYLAGDNREEGDTVYVRRSLVDELARIANMAKLHIHGFGAEEIKAKIDEAIAALEEG